MVHPGESNRQIWTEEEQAVFAKKQHTSIDCCKNEIKDIVKRTGKLTLERGAKGFNIDYSEKILYFVCSLLIKEKYTLEATMDENDDIDIHRFTILPPRKNRRKHEHYNPKYILG